MASKFWARGRLSSPAAVCCVLRTCILLCALWYPPRSYIILLLVAPPGRLNEHLRESTAPRAQRRTCTSIPNLCCHPTYKFEACGNSLSGHSDRGISPPNYLPHEAQHGPDVDLSNSSVCFGRILTCVDARTLTSTQLPSTRSSCSNECPLHRHVLLLDIVLPPTRPTLN